MRQILTSKRWAIFLIVLLVVSFVGCFQAAQYSYDTTYLDVERPTSAPATSTVVTTKEPVVVVVSAATNEPRYAAANLYAEAGVVTELDYTADVVTFMDARGMYWSFYGVEDWQVGDLLCAILYDAGTLDPLDDAVIGATYHAGAY